jgi:hypothetical protein
MKKHITEKQFVDEFIDRLYLNGSKEDGKYIQTLPQLECAAKEIYREFFKENNDLNNNKDNLNNKSTFPKEPIKLITQKKQYWIYKKVNDDPIQFLYYIRSIGDGLNPMDL